MLAKLKIAFKMEGCFNEEAMAKSTCASSRKGLVVAGLQSLLLEGDSNVVTKSALKTQRLRVQATTIEYCYLISCNLCNKMLSPDKDIYMYRWSYEVHHSWGLDSHAIWINLIRIKLYSSDI